MEKQNCNLFLISTPIGNIKDISYRAVEVLKIVDLIFAEDKRVTQKLLNYYDIRKPLYIYNKDNERENTKKIIDLLLDGKKIALSSDAGCPCISDPGEVLVKTLLEKKLNFEIIPGPTAFVMALVYSGFDTGSFFFQGFIGHKKNERTSILKELQFVKATLIFYESCHRIKESLYDILNYFEPPIFVCRELTKLFEERIYIYKRDDIDNIIEKGEFAIVVNNIIREIPQDKDSLTFINNLKKAGFTKKDILKILISGGFKRNYSYNLIQSADVYYTEDVH
jgi:16S rRNA (cytidine1402-2'-O)-methyltransferase